MFFFSLLLLLAVTAAGCLFEWLAVDLLARFHTIMYYCVLPNISHVVCTVTESGATLASDLYVNASHRR